MERVAAHQKNQAIPSFIFLGSFSMFVPHLTRLAAAVLTLLCASAQATVIDSFDQPTSASTGWAGGSNKYLYYSGPGPVGDARLVATRDGFSNVMGGATTASISGGSFYTGTNGGWTATETHLVYGQPISNFNGYTGTSLGLAWHAGDTFEVDVVSGASNLSVSLYSGSNRIASYSFGNVSTGSYSAALSSFTGISGMGSSPIDGFDVFFDGYGSTGVTVSELRLTASAVAAPVPEPETYALMIAGLGLVGALSRRRRAAR